MSASLRQISLGTNAAAEDAVGLILERELGQAPSAYTDVRTGTITVSVYFQLADEEITTVKRQLRAALSELKEDGVDPAPGQIRIRRVRPQDWSESWKRHFKPLDFGRALLVKPTWSTRKPRAGQQVVLLDPGMSFGTGQHATTHFCLEQLIACRTPGKTKSLLDAGTGSGILAIAAAKLGYRPVQAIDFDPDCLRITAENAALNGVSDLVRSYAADVTKLPKRATEKFDVICANLIYDLLISERDRLLVRLAAGGELIVAGILATQFPQVQAALEAAGMKLLVAKTRKEWRSGRFRREHRSVD